MAEAEALPLSKPRRLRFEWILPMLWRPRSTLAKVITSEGSWLAPLLVLTVMALIPVLISAPIRKEAAQMQPVEYPDGFEYWMPEQQADFERGITASSSPTFIYIVPALTGIGKIWVSWLFLGAVLHLIMTVMGSRGSMGMVLNITAWASVPLLVRFVVQVVALLATRRLIETPGLSGFAPSGDGNFAIFLGALLALFDLYVLWQAALMIAGMQTVSHLGVGKVAIGVILSFLIVLTILALPGYLGGKMGGLSVVRPFFF